MSLRFSQFMPSAYLSIPAKPQPMLESRIEVRKVFAT